MSKTVAGVEYLTNDEAAAYLGIAARTLQQWRWRGEPHVPFLKLGNKCLYRQADLDSYLRSRQRDGQQ